MFLVNLIIVAVVAKDQLAKKEESKTFCFAYAPPKSNSPYHYTNPPDPLMKSFEDRLKKIKTLR